MSGKVRSIRVRRSNSINRPIRQFFCEADPEVLIKVGAPPDEYDIEADRILALVALEPPQNIEDCFHVIWTVFKHFFGHKEEQAELKLRFLNLSGKFFEFLQIQELKEIKEIATE